MWFRSFFLTKFDHFQTVQEVGEAMMTSLKVDKNGACYAVMPDSPLIEFPNYRTSYGYMVKGSRHTSLEILGKKPVGRYYL